MSFALWFLTIAFILFIGKLAIGSGAAAAGVVADSGGGQGCLVLIVILVVLVVIAMCVGCGTANPVFYR